MDYEMDLEPTGPQVTVREVSRGIPRVLGYKKKLTNPTGGALPRRLQIDRSRPRIRQLPPTNHPRRSAHSGTRLD